MLRPSFGRVRVALVALAVTFLAHANADAAGKKAAGGQAESAAELLPASTLVYAEITQPKELIHLVLDHPLLKQIEQSPDYQKAVQSPQFQQFRQVVGLLEQKAGVPWRRALEEMTGGGVALAFDPASQGVVMLVRSTEPKTTERVRDALFELARQDAAGKGQPDPVKSSSYRGLTTHEAGEARMATMGPWLVLSNKGDLAKGVADTFLDGGKTLAADAEFAKSRQLATANPAVGGARTMGLVFVRVAPLRAFAAAAGKQNPLLDPDAKSDNPGVELLFGGLIPVAQNTPYMTASLSADREGVRLWLAAPHDPSWVQETRRFYFAPSGQKGGAARPLRPKGTVFSATTYRDLAALWQAAPDLFTEGVAAGFAQADSQFSMFLGGKSFGTDILGALQPQVQFVAARQDYKAAGVPEPTIKLPGMATIFRLKRPEAKRANIAKNFRVAFNTIVALVNLDNAANGRPLLEAGSEKRGGADILYAVYEAPEPAEDAGAGAAAGGDAGEGPAMAMGGAEADMYLNFSPALVVSDDYLMFCSTRQIAEELADLAAEERQAGSGGLPTLAENTLVEVDGHIAADLLRENREQLIAQNMLEKGNDREAAEREIDVFVSIVNAFRDASLRLTTTQDTVTLEVRLRTAQ